MRTRGFDVTFVYNNKLHHSKTGCDDNLIIVDWDYIIYKIPSTESMCFGLGV